MSSSHKPAARTNLLHVDLKDLKKPWLNWCSVQGLTPSEAVRRLIRETVERGVRPSGLELVEAKSESARRRLEIRMVAAQYEAMRAAAEVEGTSLPRWLQSLIIVHLQKRAQFGAPELEALTRSSQALLAIGRGINQILRSTHDGNRADGLSVAQLNFLRDLITSHTREVAKILAANSRRWQ